jgi:hypothetical protein
MPPPRAPGRSQGDGGAGQFEIPRPERAGRYTVTAILQYRKVDQFLTNYFLGENALTAPVVEIARATAVFEVSPAPAGSSGPAGVVRIVSSE